MSSTAHSTYSNQSWRRSPSSTKPYVVVIFGHTGVGISSLANLIAGHPISKDHPNAKTSIRKLIPSPPVMLPGCDKQFCLYEVPGFCGQFLDKAILETIRQIDQKAGIDLFIYCLRKQKTTIIPGIVHRIRGSVVGPNVPMIAVVTELERFESVGGMDDWWFESLEEGGTNGAFIERECLGRYGRFDAYACVTTLPRREVDHVPSLRKQREVSEERIWRLIEEQCARPKRPGEYVMIQKSLALAC